jgi:ligand-binding SRPBCC domain-containing protein
MAAGALIDYRLRLHGLPLRWRTAITIGNPPSRFCATQVRGPYREGVHTHAFEDEHGGTRVATAVRIIAS